MTSGSPAWPTLNISWLVRTASLSSLTISRWISIMRSAASTSKYWIRTAFKTRSSWPMACQRAALASSANFARLRRSLPAVTSCHWKNAPTLSPGDGLPRTAKPPEVGIDSENEPI